MTETTERPGGGPDPVQQLFQVAMGYVLSSALYVVTDAGVADHLGAGPKNVADLAKATGKNEDALYRVLGIIDYRLYSHQAAAQSIAHGTQVMDQACGADPATVDPKHPKRPIVAVQLPTRTTATSSGADLAPHVTEAIDYILYCSDQIAAAHKVSSLPVVINFSYGRYAGPHDGTHLLEQLIDRRIAQRESLGVNGRLRVVLPAGNGRTEVNVKVGGHELNVPVDRSFSFPGTVKP